MTISTFQYKGVRGGAATVFYPLWHREAEALLVLKNNRGVEDNRARHMDYGVQINKTLYTRLIKGGNISLFSPNEVPGLLEAFYRDQDEFERLYTKYEADESIERVTVKAVDLFSILMQERASTGRIYVQNVDHCNTHSAFNPVYAPVTQSNLCVHGETLILTSEGYKRMDKNVGKKFTIWNGTEWSEDVEIVKTNTNQKLFEVTLSDGRKLKATEYHRWSVMNNYYTLPVIKRTNELEIGMRLEKWEAPVIQGSKTLDNAFENGFFTADGCQVKNTNVIYLYGSKKKLIDNFKCEIANIVDQPDQDRIVIRAKNLKEKYFIPDETYTIESRLEWLAGFLAGDGTVHRNGSNESLAASSVNKDFLDKLSLMLLTLGIHSKVRKACDGGLRKLPLNNGKGEYGEFYCQPSYRILLNSSNSLKLLRLGIKLRRLEFKDNSPQRDATQFVYITDIKEVEGLHDTYCVHEPKAQKAIFNGIMTHNCMEITLPTKPMTKLDCTDGEIALCILSGVNMGEIHSIEDMEEPCELLVRVLDAIIDYQEYPVKAAEYSCTKRRMLGIGVINYAYFLAKHHTRYSKENSRELTHKYFEALQYYCLKASVQLAKEYGPCELFHETNYAQGLLPIDTYKRDLDQICDSPYQFDWEVLREEIAKYGLRNSCLTSQFPSETSSQISNATNGIEPPRGYVSVKASKDGILKQVVPEFSKYAMEYELLWEMPDNKGYLENVAVMQKFIDQAISTNTNYDPKKFPDGKVPMKVLLQDLLYAYKLGVKTLYYQNTRDGADDKQDDLDDGCAGGACKL
nr:MAG TPA: ribonucleotide-diphosphate reductase subunit alpha [Bacteriophage sp.]